MAHVLSFSLSLFFLSFSTAFSLSSNYFPFASRQRMEDNGSNVVSTWLSSGRKALGLSLPFSLRDLQGAVCSHPDEVLPTLGTRRCSLLCFLPPGSASPLLLRRRCITTGSYLVPFRPLLLLGWLFENYGQVKKGHKREWIRQQYESERLFLGILRHSLGDLIYKEVGLVGKD